MTHEQIIKICGMYDDMLMKDGFLSVKENDEHGSLNNVRWMLKEIPKFLSEHKMEKSMRWLGFIQGVLWTHGYCDIKSRKDNKPVEEDKGKTSFMMYGD